MTVKELVAGLTHSPDDANKTVYVSTKDVSNASNTTHNVGEIIYYDDTIVIYASRH